MRGMLYLFAALVGAVIVAVVSRYGFRTADNEIDGYVVGTLMGAIAFGGMAGHAVAVRLWTMSHHKTAVLLGMIAAGAMTMNLSNSLGALLGRGSDKLAVQLKTSDNLRSDRATLARKESERQAMTFKPVDADTVAAMARASAAATAAREAECARRGTECRKREADEREALEAEAAARASKTATERASALDTEIASLKAKIEAVGPIKDESSGHGAALATMFRLPKDMGEALVSWQNFLIGAVAEFLIIGSLIAAEVMRPARRVEAPPAAKLEPVQPEQAVAVIEPVEQPRQAPEPIRQITDQRRKPTVQGIMVAMIEKAGDADLDFVDIVNAYRARCQELDVEPADMGRLGSELRAVCRKMKIDVESDGERATLKGARLKA